MDEAAEEEYEKDLEEYNENMEDDKIERDNEWETFDLEEDEDNPDGKKIKKPKLEKGEIVEPDNVAEGI